MKVKLILDKGSSSIDSIMPTVIELEGMTIPKEVPVLSDYNIRIGKAKCYIEGGVLVGELDIETPFDLMAYYPSICFQSDSVEYDEAITQRTVKTSRLFAVNLSLYPNQDKSIKTIAEQICNNPNEQDVSNKPQLCNDIEDEWFREFVLKSK